MPKYAIVVNQAIRANALIIHAGHSESKFSDYYLPSGEDKGLVSDSPSIMVQIEHGGFERKWGEIYRSALAQYFRSQGAPKKDASRMANEALTAIGTFADFRLDRRSTPSGKMLYLKPGGPEDVASD